MQKMNTLLNYNCHSAQPTTSLSAAELCSPQPEVLHVRVLPGVRAPLREGQLVEVRPANRAGGLHDGDVHRLVDRHPAA